MTTLPETYRPHDFINQLQVQLKEYEKHPHGMPGRLRGMLADLRHGFSTGTAYRAFPHLAGYCDLTQDSQRAAMVVIGGGLATHLLSDSSAGNLGVTLRKLACGDKDNPEALHSFEARFRRLISCDDIEDLCQLLPGILRAAKRQSCPVNYHTLADDLMKWGETVKIRWAAAYWGTSTSIAEEVTT